MDGKFNEKYILDFLENAEQMSVLIKPTHGCNLNCDYCYDAAFRKEIGDKELAHEDISTLFFLLEDYFNKVNLIWHGGEPLYVSQKWYEEANHLIESMLLMRIDQSMQSNGLLINDEWIDVFKKNNIEVGVSFDGPFQKIRGADYRQLEFILKSAEKSGLRTGNIVVINKENFRHMIDIYEYFAEKFKTVPAFNQVFGSSKAIDNNLEMTPKEYSVEYRKFIEHWAKDTRGVGIERTIGAFIGMIFGMQETTCKYSDCRFKWINQNPNGDLYPCDRYFPKKYKMGSVNEFDDLVDVFLSDGYQNYANDVELRFDKYCRPCKYFVYCQGACNATHLSRSGSVSGLDHVHCESFDFLFRETYDFLRTFNVSEVELNPIFTKYLVERSLYTPFEIRKFMSDKGYDIGVGYKKNSVLESLEFNVFTIFHPRIVGVADSHLDIEILNVATKGDGDYSLKEIKGSRMEMLESIYLEKESEILKVMQEFSKEGFNGSEK